MASRARSLALLAAALALAGCLGFLIPEGAPAFAVETAEGGTWNLTAHRGQPVVVEFMSTTCKPCHEQSAALREVAGARPDAALVSLSVSPYDNASALRDWKADHDAAWPHAPNGTAIAVDYRVATIPQVVAVTADGHLAWRPDAPGVVPVDRLLDEMPPPG